jgi:hypothetical protein
MNEEKDERIEELAKRYINQVEAYNFLTKEFQEKIEKLKEKLKEEFRFTDLQTERMNYKFKQIFGEQQ